MMIISENVCYLSLKKGVLASFANTCICVIQIGQSIHPPKRKHHLSLKMDNSCVSQKGQVNIVTQNGQPMRSFRDQILIKIMTQNSSILVKLVEK